MARRRRERMSEGKKNIIAALIQEYDIKSTEDIQGVKHKKLLSSYGEIPIDVPQDRDGDFEPQIVQKCKKGHICNRAKNHCNVG